MSNVSKLDPIRIQSFRPVFAAAVAAFQALPFIGLFIFGLINFDDVYRGNYRSPDEVRARLRAEAIKHGVVPSKAKIEDIVAANEQYHATRRSKMLNRWQFWGFVIGGVCQFVPFVAFVVRIRRARREAVVFDDDGIRCHERPPVRWDQVWSFATSTKDGGSTFDAIIKYEGHYGIGTIGFIIERRQLQAWHKIAQHALTRGVALDIDVAA